MRVVPPADPETLLDPNLSPEVKDAAVNIMNELDAVKPTPQPDTTQLFINGVNGNVDRIIDSRGKPKPQLEPTAPDADTARLIDLFKSGLDGKRQTPVLTTPTDNVTQAFFDGLNSIRRNTDTNAPTTEGGVKAIVENERDKATTAETATVEPATIEPASDLVERIDVDENTKKEYTTLNDLSDDRSRLNKAKNLRKNVKRGSRFEKRRSLLSKLSLRNPSPQITILTSVGVKVRVDNIGFDRKTGEMVIEEYKSSKTARLTKNQQASFLKTDQEIINSAEERVFVGGTVVGKGKGKFKGGTTVPEGTKVRIIRHK